MTATTFTIAMQVRSSATRLPGKMTRIFSQGRTIPELMLKELQRYFAPEKIVLATSTSPSDDVIAEMAMANNVRHFRGSESDVLDRILKATDEQVEFIVRVCGDNPFLRAELVCELFDALRQNPDCDYLSFQMRDGTPTILSHTGLFAEIVRRSQLVNIARISTETRHHEHITSHILDNRHMYKCSFIAVPTRIQEMPELRLTVDTAADFTNSSRLYDDVVSRFGCHFSTDQLLDAIAVHQDLLHSMAREIEANRKA